MKIQEEIESFQITNSKTIISFEKNNKNWSRFISIEGKRAYEIGNVCQTCAFYFERLEGANQKIEPKEVIDKLNNGITTIDQDLLNKISKIIPDGNYRIMLLEVEPKMVDLGTDSDYFKNEQITLWGLDGFWGIPHHTKIPYYRTKTESLDIDKELYEFLIPMYPKNYLDIERVNYYKDELLKGKKPTGISISVLDIKGPAAQGIGSIKSDISEHWCLAHYLIDGHHKLYGASETNSKMTILSFLAIDECIMNKAEYINKLINFE